MNTYRVWMTVVGTASFSVEANSEEEAKEKANELYSDTTISICHQCAGDISEPTITMAVDAVELD